MFGFFKKLMNSAAAPDRSVAKEGHRTVEELAKRLGVIETQLRAIEISYREFQIPKRTGGSRTILAPSGPLKAIQRTILRRLLKRLRAHSAATGFEREHSIVTNALPHVNQDVVIKLDVRDFFPSIKASRIDNYLRKIGWNADASALLTKLCTHNGSLPQGAPTSPRLSNLVNFNLDTRLAAAADKLALAYSRYADDITFSGPATKRRPTEIIHTTKEILREEGYTLHTDKKLCIARRGDRQIVTGLVVNAKPNLPRHKRRWLRAVEHHLQSGKPASITEKQLEGWKSLRHMIAQQSSPA